MEGILMPIQIRKPLFSNEFECNQDLSFKEVNIRIENVMTSKKYQQFLAVASLVAELITSKTISKNFKLFS
jgi:hypothetical protein